MPSSQTIAGFGCFHRFQQQRSSSVIRTDDGDYAHYRTCMPYELSPHAYIHTYIHQTRALEDWCYSSSHYQSSLSHFGLPCSVHVWDKEFSNIQVVEVRLEDLRVPCEWCYKKRLVRSVYLFLQYVDKGTAKVIHHLIKLHGLNVAQ